MTPPPADILSGPSKGTLTLDADGSFEYEPGANFKKGSDSFTYEVSDGKGSTDEARVTIEMKKKKKK